MARVFFTVAFFVWLGSCAVAGEACPWKSGEKLTYRIHWGTVEAAEAVFTIKETLERWEIRLHLQSKGAVRTLYPIDDWFWAFIEKQPWRSLEYGEIRSEKNRHINERTRMDYGLKLGTRERWNLGTVEMFNWDGRNLDDIGSVLYSLRGGVWKKGTSRELFVYESSNVKRGLATCRQIEEKRFGNWPSQRMLEIHARPADKESKKGQLVFWMTDDEKRLPVQARLTFKYGTFTLHLVKVEQEAD
jgi:hypothetical protein